MPRAAEFEALNTKIVAVSFGTAYWARAWMQETQSPFPVWLDATRDSYTAYGLDRSVLASWGPANLWYYAKALVRGEQLQEKRGDTDQLGGNFIVDNEGMIRFVYPSKDPTDRPEIDDLLVTLKALAEK